MNPLEKKILNDFKNLLIQRVRLYRLILFGSRARGDAHPESDMDVLVIIEDKYTPQIQEQVSECGWEAGFEAGIVVSSLIYTRDEWENGPESYSPFVETVRREGVPI